MEILCWTGAPSTRPRRRLQPAPISPSPIRAVHPSEPPSQSSCAPRPRLARPPRPRPSARASSPLSLSLPFSARALRRFAVGRPPVRTVHPPAPGARAQPPRAPMCPPRTSPPPRRPFPASATFLSTRPRRPYVPRPPSRDAPNSIQSTSPTAAAAAAAPPPSPVVPIRTAPHPRAIAIAIPPPLLPPHPRPAPGPQYVISRKTYGFGRPRTPPRDICSPSRARDAMRCGPASRPWPGCAPRRLHDMSPRDGTRQPTRASARPSCLSVRGCAPPCVWGRVVGAVAGFGSAGEASRNFLSSPRVGVGVRETYAGAAATTATPHRKKGVVGGGVSSLL